LKRIRFCDTDAAIVQHLVDSFKQLGEKEIVEDDVELAYQWCWLENGGIWKKFDPNENFQIEMAYLIQNRKGKMTTVITGDYNQQKNGYTYEIDFDGMTELNMTFRTNLRPIKREPIKQTGNYVWEIQCGPRGDWVTLGQTESQQVELAFFERKVPDMKLQWRGNMLHLDFHAMEERNSKRRINRSDAKYENRLQLQNKKEKKTAEAPKQPPEDEVENVKCCLIGLAQDIPKGEQWLTGKIKEMTTTESLSFEHNVPASVTLELPAIRKKYSVRIQVDKTKITLTGLRMPVVQAKTDILELERTSSTTFRTPPSYWDPQKENLEVKDVPKVSEMWNQIEKRMKETIASVQIHQIQRIQNLFQWEKYCFLKDRIQRKYDPQELLLFHGTRLNSPTIIYTGEDGFDMRYSAQGMWGKASYFAYNASYSHGYSSQLPNNGLRQMFYARVSVGKDAQTGTNNNSSTIKPPDGYDSVSGITQGSKVYMVYENGRAYPEYLITYSA